MRISREELEAVRTVVALGEQWGFGNLISYLQTAWRLRLVRNWGMDEGAASRAAGGPGYPEPMYRDLIERGEWDETGRRYAESE